MQIEIIQLSAYEHYFKARPRDWHKGLSGRVLVIGGDYGFAGASLLTALAALRVGAGLVTIATRPAHSAMMHVAYPEIMCTGIDTAEELLPFIEKASCIVLGPGLGQSDWSFLLWQTTFRAVLATTPLLIDADALNLLARQSLDLTIIRQNWILTPHPGEAARLLQNNTQYVQSNRYTAARRISEHYGGVCVLKGAKTLVVMHKAEAAVCLQGNPGMASAGMGDILSGVIGGLIAQGIPLCDASKLGVCLHATAGDLAAAKDGERGMIASDLLPYLRQLVNNPLDLSNNQL